MADFTDAQRCPVCGSADVSIGQSVTHMQGGVTAITNGLTTCHDPECPTQATRERPVDELLDELLEGDVS